MKLESENYIEAPVDVDGVAWKTSDTSFYDEDGTRHSLDYIRYSRLTKSWQLGAGLNLFQANNCRHVEHDRVKELLANAIPDLVTIKVEIGYVYGNDYPVAALDKAAFDEWYAAHRDELRGEINGDTSDGYHTFDELYHHRAVLFSVIVRDHRELAWKARKHHDGTMYDGMFIVGIDTPKGQATYHYNLDPYWDMFDCEEREYAPEWDGHTPDDAIARIAELGNGTCENPHSECRCKAQSHHDTCVMTSMADFIARETRVCPSDYYDDADLDWCDEDCDVPSESYCWLKYFDSKVNEIGGYLE